MKLSFHGADQDATGSCHLLECLGRRILIDCGMRQGSRELVEENAEPFGFDPATIDIVLLTHAHLDHCGRLPLLVKRGFKGEIIATAATRELARLVIVDAANLQEEDLRRRARHRRRHGDESPPQPLYSLLDAFAALGQFGRAATYCAPIELAPGIRATFIDVGHFPGSASILVEVVEQGERRSVLFSGDIGNAERPLLRPPATPASADFHRHGIDLRRPFASLDGRVDR
jgi:metallo-beta-lactamase family protein